MNSFVISLLEVCATLIILMAAIVQYIFRLGNHILCFNKYCNICSFISGIFLFCLIGIIMNN